MVRSWRTGAGRACVHYEQMTFYFFPSLIYMLILIVDMDRKIKSQVFGPHHAWPDHELGFKLQWLGCRLHLELGMSIRFFVIQIFSIQ